MQDKKLLMVGIDPGITVGYAVVDLDGRVLCTGSYKNGNLSRLIESCIYFGRIIRVGTDKQSIPDLVQKFAAKVGAHVTRPSHDLFVEEKNSLASGCAVANEHERDALASALYAYRELKPLLHKIDCFLEDSKKPHLKDKMRELVIKHSINIKDAFQLLEKPKKKEEQIVKLVVEERKLKEEDYWFLYNKLKKAEEIIELLRQQNLNLQSKIKDIDSISRLIAKRLPSPYTDEKLKKHLQFKERDLMIASKKFQEKEIQTVKLKEDIHLLEYFMSSLNDCILLKRLKNLGHNFELDNKIVNIQAGDVLLVEDPSIVSDKTVDALRHKVHIIIHEREVSHRMKEKLPFIFIPASRLSIHKHTHFAFVHKDEFIQEKNKADVLPKLVENYRKERAEEL